MDHHPAPGRSQLDEPQRPSLVLGGDRRADPLPVERQADEPDREHADERGLRRHEPAGRQPAVRRLDHGDVVLAIDGRRSPEPQQPLLAEAREPDQGERLLPGEGCRAGGVLVAGGSQAEPGRQGHPGSVPQRPASFLA